MKNWLATTWSISNRFGWGIYGLNLILELQRRGSPTPISLGEITTDTLPPEVNTSLKPLIEFREQNLSQMFRSGKVANLQDTVVLHAMGNDMEWGMYSEAFLGDVNIGVIFFEYTDLSPSAIERASRLDAIVAGSTWNGERLTDAGIANVRTVFQGIDTSLFRPRKPTGAYDGRFTVFSGGKLDFRKGQDIVIAAFKIFSDRHPDALLVTAWQNLWPLTALPFASSQHTEGLPNIFPDGRLNLTEWIARNGIDPDRFIDIGLRSNAEMPDLLRDMDLAVFPNRCEGGTNLVAMETMACGIPCIIAANTGQLDLVSDDRCYILHEQGAVETLGDGTTGWGESSVEELVDRMEEAYENRDEAKRLGQAGSDFMRDWSWRNQIGKLLESIEEFC